MKVEIQPCSNLSLIELSRLFSDCFAGYPVPITLDAEGLARRVRREQIDLHRSVALYQGGDPVGLALLGIRGERHWCGGFGIIAARRGRGLAKTLWDAMMAQVRGPLSLEVLATNSVALDFYLKQGMKKNRELLVMEGEGGGQADPQEADPVPLIMRSERSQAPAWQRDIPALLTLSGLRGYVTADAYVVIDSTHTIVDAGARSAESAAQLISTLQGKLRLVNEPEGSSFSTVLPETCRQFELTLEAPRNDGSLLG